MHHEYSGCGGGEGAAEEWSVELGGVWNVCTVYTDSHMDRDMSTELQMNNDSKERLLRGSSPHTYCCQANEVKSSLVAGIDAVSARQGTTGYVKSLVAGIEGHHTQFEALSTEEDEEEWFNRKIKWRERSNSA